MCLSRFSRETEPIEIYRDMHKRRRYRHWLTWLWSLRRLPSENWRCRVSFSLSAGLRTSGRCGVSPAVQSLRTRSWDVQGQEKRDVLGQEVRKKTPSFDLFCSIRPSKDWMMPTHIDEGGPLYSVCWVKGNTLTDTARNDVLPGIWASLRPVKSTHTINHQKAYSRIFFLTIIIFFR